MAEKKPDRVPGRNEPDPLNIRQRSFQGGTDSLTQPPTDNHNADVQTNQGPYAKFEARDVTSVSDGAAQADAGAAPAILSEPDIRT